MESTYGHGNLGMRDMGMEVLPDHIREFGSTQRIYADYAQLSSTPMKELHCHPLLL